MMDPQEVRSEDGKPTGILTMLNPVPVVRIQISGREVLHKASTKIVYMQGGSNMTGTNCDLFTHK
jgi:hypothetical protein